jgi:hypothetical protein
MLCDLPRQRIFVRLSCYAVIATELSAAMSETERLRALARYAYERDRLPIDFAEAKAPPPRTASNHRPASRRRLLAGFVLPALIIDGSLAQTDQSLKLGLTISDYVSFAKIGALTYAALALVVLARRLWRPRRKPPFLTQKHQSPLHPPCLPHTRPPGELQQVGREPQRRP